MKLKIMRSRKDLDKKYVKLFNESIKKVKSCKDKPELSKKTIEKE
jgi:hypothetical protein